MRYMLVLAAAALLAGCGDDDATGPDTTRRYNQVQRLGNPLVSEVLLTKRSHPVHGNIGPADDAALVGAEILGFVTGVAGRSEAYANLLGTVLLPDMLVVQTNRDAGTAGWLTWALADGYGGRRLEDDVTDLALLAVFGDPLAQDPAGAAGKEALTTDNVASDSPFTASFPYLAAPN